MNFKAILTLQGKRIGIISEGDYADTFEPAVDNFLGRDLDYIVCCNRSYNKENSTHKLFSTKYAPHYPHEVLWANWVDDASKMMSANQKTAMCLVERILQDLLQIPTATPAEPLPNE